MYFSEVMHPAYEHAHFPDDPQQRHFIMTGGLPGLKEFHKDLVTRVQYSSVGSPKHTSSSSSPKRLFYADNDTFHLDPSVQSPFVNIIMNTLEFAMHILY